MNEENSLLTGAVRPALLRYALPIILSMVATQFYAVADTMIIGQPLDADALAAVSNASTVLMIFLFISGGMELGGGLLVAAGKPTATKHEMTELLYNLLFVDEVIALLTSQIKPVTDQDRRGRASIKRAGPKGIGAARHGYGQARYIGHADGVVATKAAPLRRDRRHEHQAQHQPPNHVAQSIKEQTRDNRDWQLFPYSWGRAIRGGAWRRCSKRKASPCS